MCWNLDGDCDKSVDCFWLDGHCSNPWAWEIFTSLITSVSFFKVWNFYHIVFSIAWLELPQDILYYLWLLRSVYKLFIQRNAQPLFLAYKTLISAWLWNTQVTQRSNSASYQKHSIGLGWQGAINVLWHQEQNELTLYIDFSTVYCGHLR